MDEITKKFVEECKAKISEPMSLEQADGLVYKTFPEALRIIEAQAAEIERLRGGLIFAGDNVKKEIK
jgi:hypothetical protein